jgi:4-amino-4-deoxy-L-arabinose transferase-like glycosyltransferase
MRFDSRWGHHLTLLAAVALLTLPNLGTPSLWDQDEGLNAEAARELDESGQWIVPTFNFQLRTAKPILLYWLQVPMYQLFGVNEWSARLPAVLCALLAVLATYELGRRLFDPLVGLVAGLILISCVQVAMLAHAATPDAPLLACVTLTLLAFYRGYAEKHGWRGWFLTTALAMAAGMLAKGPVGVVVPGAIIVGFLLWERQVWRVLDRRVGWALLLFLAVAAPWYVLVGLETRGEWPKAFFLRENLERAARPMEAHSGPVWYYPLAWLIGFAPWSAFVVPVSWWAWHTVRTATTRDQRAVRFLLVWALGWLAVFSLAATKLPNYIAPAYPAFALLTAAMLVRWSGEGRVRSEEWGGKSEERGVRSVQSAECGVRSVEGGDQSTFVGANGAPSTNAVSTFISPLPTAHSSLSPLPPPPSPLPTLLMGFGLIGVALTGALVTAGLLIVGGATSVALRHPLPGLERWAGVGGVLVLAAGLAAWAWRCQQRAWAVGSVMTGALAFVAAAGALVAPALETHKAPRGLVAASGACERGRELRCGMFQYFQPSLVFYCQREVRPLATSAEAVQFLATPLPTYLFVPAPVWEQLADQAPAGCRVVAQRYDFYRRAVVVVVRNAVE